MFSRILVGAFLAVLSLPAYCQSPPANNLTTVPDYVLYNHFLFRVTWLETQANNLKAQGKDDTFMRSWIKVNAGLTSAEEANLKAIAADCTAQNSAIVAAVQALAAANASPANNQQALSLRSQQLQMIQSHVTQLQAAFGTARYSALDAFVRRTVKIAIGTAPPPPASVKPPSGPLPGR